MTTSPLERNAGFHPHRTPSSPDGAWAEMRNDDFLTLIIWRHHAISTVNLPLAQRQPRKSTVSELQVKVPNTTTAIAKTP